MTSALLRAPGAVAADGPDADVAAHYGDPFREQRRLAEAVGLVDRSARAVVRVDGPDRLSWLHSLTTQHLTSLPPFAGTEALILSPHGHVEHHLVLADDGSTTWIDVEPGTAPALVEYLESMRFLLRVDAVDATAEWAVLSLVGPATPAVLDRRLAVRLPDRPYAAAPLPGGGLVRRMPGPGTVAADLLVPRGSVASLRSAVDAPLAGMTAYEALRVESRRPRLGWETDHRTIPHEVGWVGTAVHLDKGCYRGQETVARVHNLGRPPRRLVFLHLDGSADVLPPRGEPVLFDGRPVGFVGTAVRHHELGAIALAVVRWSTPDDAPLTTAGVAANAERVVDHSPVVTRR